MVIWAGDARHSSEFAVQSSAREQQIEEEEAPLSRIRAGNYLRRIGVAQVTDLWGLLHSSVRRMAAWKE